MIGNSSSGLIEAPTFNIPTVNIGNRQKGRITGETVIQCGESFEEIKQAVNKALTSEFITNCKRVNNPYGEGDSSKKIVSTMLTFPLENIVEKSFYDLKGE